jgi:hypothetical protein
MRGHHEYVISLYNQCKNGRPAGNTAKCQSTQRDFIFLCEGCHISGNLLPGGGGVQSTSNVIKNRRGHGEMLSVMAGQMSMTSSDMPKLVQYH